MVWEQSKLPFPNLQPAPSTGREDIPCLFSHSLWSGIWFPGDTSGIKVVQRLSYHSFLGWFPWGRARHSLQVPYGPQLWLQQLLLPSQGKERGSHPSLPVLGSGCAPLRL